MVVDRHHPAVVGVQFRARRVNRRGHLGDEFQRSVYQYSLGYLLVAGLLFAWGALLKSQGVLPIETDAVLLMGDHADGA